MYHPSARYSTPPPPPSTVPIPLEDCEHCGKEALITQMFLTSVFFNAPEHQILLCPPCTTFALNQKEF